MTAHDDYAAAILALSPSAYWDFQGLAPGALADVTGHGNNLAAHGGYTLNNNVIGWDGFQYGSLDGSSAYFSCPSSAYVHPGAPFTIISVAQMTQGNADLVDTEDAGLTVGYGLGVANAGSGLGYFGRVSNGSGGVAAVDPNSFALYGQGWQVIGMSYDGTNLLVTVNGTTVKAIPQSVFAGGARQLTIGAKSDGTTFARGGVSDTCIIPNFVSPGQWSEIMKATPIPTVPSAQDIIPLLNSILNAVTIRAY